MAEFGMVVAKGPVHVDRLMALALDKENDLPVELRPVLDILTEVLKSLNKKISTLDGVIARKAKENPDAKRLQPIPGIGPITAAAILAFAPPTHAFKSSRDFAAWVGLTPLQQSTGGKQTLGRTSKMGERTLRRLLIIGASAVVRWSARKGAPKGSWLERMLSRKPRMLVTVALANKMARIVWALLTKGGTYQASAVVE